MTELTFQQRLERIEAVHQIKNVMGRYAYAHLANMHKECYELSALNTPGVRAELPFGIYEGRAGLERLYIGFFGPMDREPAGRMHLHTMTTPIIEIASDLKTGKGVWISPGHATDKYRGTEFKASWRWVKYGCDFVKEDGKWKIWHLRVYGIFATPYDKSWVESQPQPGKPAGPPPMPPEFAPDRPAHEFWQYRGDLAFPNEPVTPEPYETFDEAMAY
jgi:hypothetical protein